MKLESLNDKIQEPVSHNPEIRKQVLIRNGEIPNITQLARAIFKPGQIASIHAHLDMYEVFLTEQGKGLMKIDDKPYDMEPGVCITVEPGESHEVTNNGSEDLIITILGILDKR